MSVRPILLPGDDISQLISEKSALAINAAKANKKELPKVLLGPGLKREENNRIVAIKCGQLIDRNNTVFWIDSHFKRYIASKADKVIGFVVSKQAYTTKVDIGTNETAVLSLLAFPNATKRNKPQIEVGDAVYAQIITDCKDVEPELVCVDSDGKKHGLGVLSSTGFVITVPTHISRRLLAPDSKLVQTLGKKYKFEITIGMNGRIWINAKSLDTTLTIVNFIQSLEHLPKEQYQQICEELIQGFQTVGKK